MKQIFKGGEIATTNSAKINNTVTLPAEAAANTLLPEHLQAADLILRFANFADGRGFSLARIIKRSASERNSLHALGELLPDQLALAWACGFDSVLVSDEHFTRCGNQAWQRYA